MILELLLAHFLCLKIDAAAIDCGPSGLCQCEHSNVMDCSKTKHLPLREVCDNLKDFNITVLHLEQNGYKTLRTEDLKGCRSLISLYLRENEISFVEKFSLAKLNDLQTLDISCNQLDVYSKESQLLFALPISLKQLSLSGNLKVTDQDDAIYPDLSGLLHIEQLTLDGLKDKNFPVSYSKIHTLRKISLSGLNGNCSIPNVSNDTFKYLVHVSSLNLSSCDVQNIEAGAFKRLHNLEVLDLSENINLGFGNSRNISYSLQFTKIKSLNFSKVYSSFGLGTRLTLQDVCYLWKTNLTELVLNQNRIEVIDTNVLILLPQTLTILRVEDNRFTFGPYLLQLGCMASLEEVYGNFQNLANDPTLYMKEFKVKTNGFLTTNFTCPYAEPHFLINISKMRDNCHYFKDNRINMTRDFPMFPPKMKRLEFSNCGMQYNISKIILLPAPHNTEYLDGSSNILHSWVGPVGPFPNVKYLNLSRNYCSHIGLQFFDYFQRVEHLQIQENFLGLVLSNKYYGSVIFEKLVNVHVLNLSSNIISFLHPTLFSNMKHLTTLDLSVNNIESLTIDVDSLNSLLHLNLKYNFIHSIPSHLRKKLELNSKRLNKQFTIDLSNNTLSISCEEREFLKWMVKYRKNMLNFDDYNFLNTFGERVSADVFVKDVKKLDKVCNSYIVIIVTCSVGISVFLTAVIGGAVYKNRWKLRYLMRMSKIKHFGYKRIQQFFNKPDRFMYDVFISYANEDLRYILDKMTPKLEERDFTFCLHDKDFLPGNDIADNVLQAIGSSRKTVAVISEQFLKSKWCLFEFNMARMESIYSRGGDSCLIVILLEDVKSRSMSNEMIDWMRCNTYIEYTTESEGERLFWDNFLHVLNE